MVLYVMNGMQWTDEIGEFAAWTVRYDLWCKMHLTRGMCEAMTAVGYKERRKCLSRSQVKTIVRFLSEP